jgi:hypothetical protein
MDVPSINPMQPHNSCVVVPNTSFACKMGHHIISPIASLMQNVMKIASTKFALCTNTIKKFMHANIIMFHVQIELQKAMLKAMF